MNYNSELEGNNAGLRQILNAVNNLPSANSGTGQTTIPEGVIAEASSVVDKALSRVGNRILRFIASSDQHQKNDHEQITAGNRELGQAHGEILRQIGVDFVANLGDITWASEENDDRESTLEQARAFNRMMVDHIRGTEQLWMEGNHETSMLTPNDIYALMYSRNGGVVTDPLHPLDGYCYKDFDDKKVRVICINTEQGAADVIVGVAGYQMKWLAETALNMEGKSDWCVLTMAHHPIGYNAATLFVDTVGIIEAFIKGSDFTFTTRDGYSIAINYSDRNCQYVGHFHGHTHSYSLVRMQKRVATDTYEDVDAWEIGIPNACYTRNNQNLNSEYERIARYATPTTYDKEDVDGKRTSFTVVTICLDQNMIYADNYGVGIDREVSYKFAAKEPTNLLDDAGWVENTYLSSGNAGTRNGVECTGFIPFDGTGKYVIYLSGITATTATSNFRFAFYNENKEYITQINNTQIESNNYAPISYETGANGNIIKLDCDAFVAAYTSAGYLIAPSYFRLCSDNIDENSVITVNEPI